MKVTRHGEEGRKLQNEGYRQRILVEPGKYVGSPEHGKMAENNATNTDVQKNKLMERILNRDNLNKAYKKSKPIKVLAAWMGCRWMNFYPT